VSDGFAMGLQQKAAEAMGVVANIMPGMYEKYWRSKEN